LIFAMMYCRTEQRKSFKNLDLEEQEFRQIIEKLQV
jgi:hypothetical protein